MSKPNAPSCPRIVVVGGGAGGLELVTQLGKQLGEKEVNEIVTFLKALTDKERM